MNNNLFTYFCTGYRKCKIGLSLLQNLHKLDTPKKITKSYNLHCRITSCIEMSSSFKAETEVVKLVWKPRLNLIVAIMFITIILDS